MTIQSLNIPIMAGTLNNWARIVKGRDNYSCIVCGEKNGRLQAHHILSINMSNSLGCEDLQLLVANGETLCLKHHTQRGTRDETMWLDIPDRVLYKLFEQDFDLLNEKQALEKSLLANHIYLKEPYFSLVSQFDELVFDGEGELDNLQGEFWVFCKPAILNYLAPFRNRDWVEITTPMAFRRIRNNIKKIATYEIESRTNTQQLQNMDSYKRFDAILSSQRGILAQIKLKLKKGDIDAR